MRPIVMMTMAAMMLLPATVMGQARKPPPRPAAKPAAIVQKVIPPKAVYWLSAQTMTGFGMGGNMPSPGDMMRMAMSGQQPGAMAKSLSLDLGGKLPVSAPPPLARHLIPAGMNMGDLLFLKSPQRAAATPSEPEDYEPPRGRVLLFWGCGETARPGQPVVIDFARMAAGQVPPGLFAGERVRIARPPSYAGWPNHGHWPNDDRASRQGVPANASLIGDHAVAGNYIPDIQFSLTKDFMGALNLDQKKAPSGAIAMSWNQLPEATGHFASFMGGEGEDPAKGATVVFWSSSESQTFISALGDYIAPAEAARLVGTKQLMPPTQTNCAIPKEVMAAAPNGLVSLVAHGPEENFLFPPRPADPKIAWDQQYAVKARFVARAGGPAGMNMAEMMGDEDEDRPRRGSRQRAKPKCSDRPTAGDALGGVMGGLLGRRKKAEDCDPS
ncbi:hypothetical protein [Sandarakinorhabdus sp. AAP62]|uniref:hypothetical protein n=1 Tax=Sandarakinorhabdus sp. AAP62 TaxID=1248916 RepID=UPI0003604870|nr:hypothetical protein [Sandarakinorhabdus sp. AAP62]